MCVYIVTNNAYCVTYAKYVWFTYIVVKLFNCTIAVFWVQVVLIQIILMQIVTSKT